MTNSSHASSRSHAPDLLRELCAADRGPLEQILRSTDAFQPHEVEVALELIDEGIATATGKRSRPPHPADYRFLVAEREGALVGYVCYGLSPLTDAVFDLYWIAVDPKLHRSGVGRALLRAAETEIKQRAGRMILVDTGGKASYAPTRRFYDRAGYVEIARVPDFFAVGDDRVIYARRLDGQLLVGIGHSAETTTTNGGGGGAKTT